jgi:hypothetical protein
MADIELTRELLLLYQGLHESDGLCHVRVYEQPGRLPVVIAGGLDDNPGTAVALVIEIIAAAVQRSLFAGGREFRLIEHYRDGIDGRQTSTYSLVHFDHRSIHESPDDAASDHAGSVIILPNGAGLSPGAEIEGDFRHPHWEPIDDVEELLGCKVAVWQPGRYTARAVAGEQGEQLRRKLVQNPQRIRDCVFA